MYIYKNNEKYYCHKLLIILSKTRASDLKNLRWFKFTEFKNFHSIKFTRFVSSKKKKSVFTWNRFPENIIYRTILPRVIIFKSQ